MYTLETLIPDCVGRYIQSPTGQVELASLIDGVTYAKCWQAFIFWVVNQYDSGNSTNLAPMGTIVRTVSPLHPVTGRASKKLASFRFLKLFLDKYDLTAKNMDVQYQQDDVSSIRMNLSNLGKLAGVGPQIFRTALQHLFRRLGEVLNAQEQVLIDFNVGSLIGNKGQIEFVFHDSLEDEKVAVALDPNMLRKGAVRGNKKTKVSSETRALRKKYQLQSSPNAISGVSTGKRNRGILGRKRGKHKRHDHRSVDRSARNTQPDSEYGIASLIPSPPPNKNQLNIESLPHSTSSRFRRKLRGNSPLKRVRRGIEHKHSFMLIGDDHQAAPQPPVHPSYPSASSFSSSSSSHPSSAYSNASIVNSRALPPVKVGGSPSMSASLRGLSSPSAQPLRANANISSSTISSHKRAFRPGKNMPPVLDAFARTQAATYSDERYYQSVSAKIASFYTPEASQFTITNAGQLVYTDFMPFRPDRTEKSPQEKAHELRVRMLSVKDENPLEKRAETRSLMRYQYYVENLISGDATSPIKEEWIRNSLSLLSTNISSYVDDSRVEELVREMLVEMRDDYKISMKRSILDYVLRNTEERARLAITAPPVASRPDWGMGEAPHAPPRSWRGPIQRAYQSLSQNLFINNPAMVELLEIWQKYEHYLLVDLPSEDKLPITVQEFAMMQEKHLKSVQKIFIKDWGDEVEEVFDRYAKTNGLTDENSVRFFESVATIMSNQLRTIVQRSADAYHEFFLRYKSSPAVQFVDPNNKTLLTIRDPVWIRDGDSSVRPQNNPRPVFLQKLSVLKMKDMSVKIAYEISLQEMDKTVSQIFENIVNGLRDISRVENKIFSMIDEIKYLQINVDGEAGESIWSLKREVTGVFNRSIREAALLSSLYEEYQYILDEDTRVAAYLKQRHTLAEYKAQIDIYRKVADELSAKTHSNVRCPMILLDCSSVNLMLIDTSQKLAKQILNFVAGRNIDKNIALSERFKQVNTTLLKKPMNTKDLVDLVKYLKKFMNEERDELLKECESVKKQLDFLFDSQYMVGKEVLQQVGQTWSWLLRISDIVKSSEELVRSERQKMEKALEERRANDVRLIENYALQTKQFEIYGDIKKIPEYLSKIHSLKENIAKADEEIESLHAQQRLLGLPETDFYALQQTKNQLQPYEELWNLVNNFNKSYQVWTRGPVFTLDAAKVESEVERMWKASSRLYNQLIDHAPDPAQVAAQIKKDLASFKPHVPLLHILCNEGMRDRHWNKICDVVEFDLRPDPHTMLTRVIDMGIDKYLDELQEISEAASREWNIEKTCKSMKDEWKEVHLALTKHRDTNTYILVGDTVEEIQTLLDDHIVKTQTMKGSPYAKPFINDIKSWESWLSTTQETVEIWLKVQSAWMYLEPVFGSEDIIKSMPSEGTTFKVVDSNWHKLMSEVVSDSKMLNVTNIPHLLNMLRTDLQLLENINSRLNQYLETKRLFFPRFYFLSDTELLEILSETKNPLRVQPHMKKCFDGVYRLQFEDSLDITAMESPEGEVVPMVRVINPVDAKGAVERWLKEFEQVMRETVLDQTAKALKAYKQMPRSDWVLDWPGQVVLTVAQIYWTQECAKAIKRGKAALRSFAEKCETELQYIVMKVRGKLSKLARCTLGSLIVLDAHARDVVHKLIDNDVSDTRDFDWMSQMRYYWDENMINVRMITSDVDYGCEYLGNSTRLVITELTDRCYRTLMGAMQLRLGGAPEGPAGTGKTETVKDLAKAVGIQCIVFNCSEGLNYMSMATFFKGLVASGAWVCFDEFNRIDVEVLSVVAQQIQSIQRAKEMRLESFMFDGSEHPLQARCSIFITMNPTAAGYEGRSELPDNLKAQFRTVAMMVPDYAMIAEILLYSYGFVDARTLARKIVAVYKLCSEQLSDQDHYDYGMRAVKSVLVAAEKLKKKFPSKAEEVLILRAITDVNLPKFLAEDIELFENIIMDLFPSVKLPKPDYGDLLAALKEVCVRMNLDPVPALILKCLQLYETISVRHGLMIVGLPYAGKTTCYRVLKAAINDLAARGKMNENKVQSCVINPKAITLGELYGEHDDISQEWKDGVLAQKFRDFANDASKDRKWLMLDGPVDAVWVENMNTVLDDNKKLCLVSGQIIHMPSNMNVLFEVRDLAQASPATVSRCGMVYMQPEMLGWRPLVKSWLTTLPPGIDEKLTRRIETLFDWLVEPCIREVNTACQKYSPSINNNLVVSLMNILHNLLKKDFQNPNVTEEMGQIKVVTWLESHFLFALVWSVGGAVDTEGRKVFDRFLREVCREVNHYKLSSHFPKKGLVFDFVYDTALLRWISWSANIDTDFSIPPNANLQSVVVPTIDTARYQFLLELAVKNSQPLLFIGPTGTGKGVSVAQYFSQLDREEWDTLDIMFSAQTSAKQTQELVDSRLDRRRRGVYGPSHQRKMIVFLDDLNMPKLEKFGAQPPIELLRQVMDHGGWYDIQDGFHQLTDVQFVSAMSPMGGGRNQVTDRLLRHFTQVSMTPFDDAALSTIFSTLLRWHFNEHKFSPKISSVCDKIISATKDVYGFVTSSLLPSPAKSHYTYNLRDFSRVIQGLLLSRPDQFDDLNAFLRLWVHEVHRVFCDRLIDDTDQLAFLKCVRETSKKRFNADFDRLLGHLDINGDGKVDTVEELRCLFFGDYMSRKHPRPYCEIQNPTKLTHVWKNYLEDYNDISHKPMKLVMFRFAIEHASRIVRILKQPKGNAMLVGVGGSGKQSLTRLAASVMEYNVIQIELTKSYGVQEWKDDLRLTMKRAGGEGKPTVFLFSDSQLKDEIFLEDINSILNTGEVPNLFQHEDYAEVLELVRPHAKKEKKEGDGSPATLFKYFTERVRANLHVVLCFSPIGNALRERLRNYPSLVNCCTIDWFQSWPHDALESVAVDFLHEVEMQDKTREACIDLCMYFHRHVEQLAKRYKEELGRHYYITPTSYLELMTTFKVLLSQKRQETLKQRSRYQNGLDKLVSTEMHVKHMQIELEEMQPALQKTTEQTEEMLQIVQTQTEEAEKIREGVQKEEAIAKEAEQTAKSIELECISDLAEAMPILEAAVAALDTLTPQDISEVRTMKNPHKSVKLVMECLCVMKKVAPARFPDQSTGKIIMDYWEPSKKYILSDPKLLKSLKAFDRDNVPPKIMKKIRYYISLPEFDINKIKNTSHAVHSLCSWIYAIEAYDKASKHVKPKQARLVKSKAEYEVVRRGLEMARKELEGVETRIATLNTKLEEMQAKKRAYEKNMEECTIKLERADKFLGRVGGEKERWTNIIEELGVKYTHLTGNMILSAGVIAYLGAFTGAYRDIAIKDWTEKCSEMGVTFSDDFSLSSVLGQPIDIRRWVIDGLPNDSFSIDNAIIISKSRRWPLMIDPQNQANKWIKNMEKQHKLVVINEQQDYFKSLENAIRFGAPCLMENCDEQIDPMIEPLLLKLIFRRKQVRVIRFGDADIEYSDTFRFYMTTPLHNPHYLPELSTKVALINFMITPEGLEDQLLGHVVAKEKPDLELERSRRLITNASNARKLKDIENQILQELNSAKGSILEDEHTVEVLRESKMIAIEIMEKQKIAEKTEAEIELTRAGYKPVAAHASTLFFCLSDLSKIDPMYQFSLSWYIQLFHRAISESEFNHMLSLRIETLNQCFLQLLFENVSRSLFEKDKLLFSFLLAARVDQARGNIDPQLWRFFITGGVGLSSGATPNPAPQWIEDHSWQSLFELQKTDAFNGFCESFVLHLEEWRQVLTSPDPLAQAFPSKWRDSLSMVERMAVLRCFRSDRIIPAARDYVCDTIGEEFVEFPVFDLAHSFRDSDVTSPLVFILSPGADPLTLIVKYAEETKNTEKVHYKSLGQGQGEKAAALIERGVKEGLWVVLQNCHLAPSWMAELERIVLAILPSEAHPNFRLWLTSYPSPHFPVSILQNSVKMTTEPPKGLRANLLGSYHRDPISDEKFFLTCKKQKELKTMVYALCFFHAVVQERQTFGPLGWNIAYKFGTSDLRISLQQLHMFLNENGSVPFKALIYLIGECNYGGIITEDYDRRTMRTMLGKIFKPDVFLPAFELAPGADEYTVPPVGPFSSYIDVIKALPIDAAPAVFGLHDNANITKQRAESQKLFDSILITETGKEEAGDGDKTSTLQDLASEILRKLPKEFDIEMIKAKYHVQYNESMNTVLTQECIRYNKLTNTIRNSLQTLSRALVGQVVMSEEIEKLGDSLYVGKIPNAWTEVSYPTLMNLSSYIEDLIVRIAFIKDWVEHERPTIVALDAVFFIHGFLTGVLQNFARKQKVAIDEVCFDFEFMAEGEIDSKSAKPLEGVYVSGLHFQGARWDARTEELAESLPKELFAAAPIIWLKPCRVSNTRSYPHYECPVYRTTARYGVLSTTGHSTNYVFNVRVPTSLAPAHWVERGVALITQLDY